MRSREAETLSDWLASVLELGDVCLNIGASTRHFREVDQPHIKTRFLDPLEARGVRFVHCDLKPDEGVDETGDVLDPAFRERLKKHGAQLIVCSNLLEHLTDPKAFADACADLVSPGGYAAFTVPFKYPYHADPIDTMFRPSPEELAAMLPAGWTVVRSQALVDGTYWSDLRKRGNPFLLALRHAARVALPFYRPGQWRGMASRLTFLLRPYRVSMVLAKKTGRPINSV
jgi:SAM-dependent methyltransferase